MVEFCRETTKDLKALVEALMMRQDTFFELSNLPGIKFVHGANEVWIPCVPVIANYAFSGWNLVLETLAEDLEVVESTRRARSADTKQF